MHFPQNVLITIEFLEPKYRGVVGICHIPVSPQSGVQPPSLVCYNCHKNYH